MIAARQIFLGRGGAKLPYDAEVEYLESTGTQWIDTGVFPSSSTSVEVVYKISSAQLNTCIFSARKSATSNSFSVWNDINGHYRFDYTASGADNKDGPSSIVGSYVTLKKDGNRNYVNGIETAANTAKTFSCVQTAYLFAMNNGGVANFFVSAMCASCKIWQDGVLVRDFIPVRFTNELGQSEGAMYDRVSGQLFRNQGTGAFLYGRDINPISARSYVNDGLVAMWDGTENAGWGVHDANATVWKDLVGNCDISLYNAVVNPDNIYFGKDVGYGVADFPTRFGAIEVVLAKSVNTANAGYDGIVIGIGATYSGWGINAPKGALTDTYDLSSAPYVLISDMELFSATLNKQDVSRYGSTTSIAKNGVIGADGTIAAGSRYAASGNINTNGSNNRNSSMWFRSIRIYSRALTAAEIAANYAVDKQRFNLP